MSVISPRRLISSLAVALGLASGGCYEFEDIPPTPLRPSTGCEGVSACPTGLTCEAGACVGGPTPARPLIVQIRPPRTGGVGAVEIRSLFADGPVLALPEIVLPTTVDLEAVLNYQGQPISARATARPQGVATPDLLEVTADPVNQGDGPRTRLALVPWWPRLSSGDRLAIRYDIQFFPQIEAPDDLPPWLVSGISVLEGVGADQRAFDLPGPEGLITVEGRVALSPALATPLQGVTLYAQDAQGRRVSTEATTDEDGRFALKLWRPERETEYTVKVIPARPDRPLPTLDVTALVPSEGEAAFQTIFVGEVGTLVQRVGRLQGSVGDDVTPIIGATLRFVGEVAGGRYETWALVDVEGNFTAALFPGTYQVGVAPPISEDFRYTRLRLDVAPAAPDDPATSLVLTVRPRTRVIGQIVAPDGDPLPQSMITATLQAAAAGDPSLQPEDFPPPIREISSLADEDGRFELFLDPGAHEITIQPPVGRGLPTLLTEATVPVDQVSALDLRTLEIPPAAALSLALRQQDGAPVKDAVIEVWWEETASRVLAGQGSSDADGQVRLRLPGINEDAER